MKVVKILFLAILGTSLLAACNRKENSDIAGKGGSGVLNCTPAHHEVYTNITNGKIYIKYNTQNIPNSYDDSAVCVLVNGKPTATFKDLKKGDYYLYGKGFDTSISAPVKGGIPYAMSDETTLNILVPVTED